jgi:hypothetical protein
MAAALVARMTPAQLRLADSMAHALAESRDPPVRAAPAHSTYAAHGKAWRGRQPKAGRRPWLWAQTGCRQRIDRNAQVRLLFQARAWNRRHRAPGQHGGPLARTGIEVLAALLRIAARHGGQCFPSYDAIAAEAGCARSVAALAITRLERAGLLSVTGRRAKGTRRDGRLLPVVTSNAYAFPLDEPKSENRHGIRPDFQKPVVRNPDRSLDNALASAIAALEASWTG